MPSKLLGIVSIFWPFWIFHISPETSLFSLNSSFAESRQITSARRSEVYPWRCHFSFDLFRMPEKKLKMTLWTFVWTLSVVKNIPRTIKITVRMWEKMLGIPQIVEGEDLRRTFQNTARYQSTCNRLILNVLLYLHRSYLHLLSNFSVWICISLCRKNYKKRSRSSSSSSSSSSNSPKDECLPHESFEVKDDVFNKAKLDQRESPGNSEGARPPGGLVSSLGSTVWSVSA